IGERQKVLVTEESFDAQYYVAHNKFYEQSAHVNAWESGEWSVEVLVPKQPEFTGKMIEVDVYEAGKHFLKGRPADDRQPVTACIAEPLRKGQVSGLTQEPPVTTNGRCHGVLSVDRERLKTLGLGLALAAAILALLLEKLF
ncbi:hypothetical protein CRUP_036072, partial [Coryphaenoides rupestris]